MTISRNGKTIGATFARRSSAIAITITPEHAVNSENGILIPGDCQKQTTSAATISNTTANASCGPLSGSFRHPSNEKPITTAASMTIISDAPLNRSTVWRMMAIPTVISRSATA